VLDVGGGRGLLTFYAAWRGAAKPVCLEPLAQGSRKDEDAEFKRCQEELGLENVQLSRERLQDYDAANKFDVVLLHNSVNHLDEDACIHLLERDQARETYRKIFSRLATLANPGAHLLIVDCSRKNLFPLVGLTDPFARSIDWRKHQTPEVWITLLEECGFAAPEIRWASFTRLRTPGRILLGYRVAAFLLSSRFWLHMRRSADS
jgi:SAM-dependent methyltransferase